MAAALRAFIRVVDGISLAGGVAAALAMAAMSAIMFAEIVARTVLGVALPFSWEYAAYLMSAVFFLGAAYTLRSGVHVRMGLFVQHASPAVARAMDAAASVLALAVAAFIAYALGDTAWQAHVRGARSFTPMETYLALPQAIPAVGAALLALQLVARLVTLAIGEPVERPPAGGEITVDR